MESLSQPESGRQEIFKATETAFPLSPDLRRATDSDVPALRRLVNDAYRELADMGLKYTGTYQDEAITRERMANAEVYLLEKQGELLASINLSIKELSDTEGPCLYINQLAVRPDQKRKGIGTKLLDFAEQRAVHSGLKRLRLDTAIPAKHLVGLYESRGYRSIAEVQWEGKTYRSYIMEKAIVGDSKKPQPMITLRDALTTDAPSLMKLALQLGYPNTEEEIAKRIARLEPTKEKLIVAIDDQDLAAGFAHLRLTQSFVSSDTVEIAALVVDKSLRGSGIGATLVRSAEEWASSAGTSIIQLRSNIKRERAHRPRRDGSWFSA